MNEIRKEKIYFSELNFETMLYYDYTNGYCSLNNEYEYYDVKVKDIKKITFDKNKFYIILILHFFVFLW